MKKSINCWSFEEGTSYAEMFAAAKAHGFEAVEPALAMDGELTPLSTKEDCEKIAAAARAVGVEIASLATGLFWRTSLTANDPAVCEAAMENARSLIERAAWLGTDAVLIIPGAVDVPFLENPEHIPYDDCWERSLAAIKTLEPFAREHNVKIGIENVGNKFLLSPLEARRFIDEVASDFVGMYLDVGNVIPIGFPEHWIKILGSRLVRVHFKDYKPGAPGGEDVMELMEGDVDWPAVAAALDKIGYDSYVTAELEPSDGLLHRTSAAMDKIFTMARKS